MYTDDTQMHKPYVCMYRRTLSFSFSISTTLSSLVFSTRRAFTASMDSCKGVAWVSELFLNMYWPHANQELSKIRPLSTHAPSAYIHRHIRTYAHTHSLSHTHTHTHTHHTQHTHTTHTHNTHNTHNTHTQHTHTHTHTYTHTHVHTYVHMYMTVCTYTAVCSGYEMHSRSQGSWPR